MQKSEIESRREGQAGGLRTQACAPGGAIRSNYEHVKGGCLGQQRVALFFRQTHHRAAHHVELPTVRKIFRQKFSHGERISHRPMSWLVLQDAKLNWGCLVGQRINEGIHAVGISCHRVVQVRRQMLCGFIDDLGKPERSMALVFT